MLQHIMLTPFQCVQVVPGDRGKKILIFFLPFHKQVFQFTDCLFFSFIQLHFTSEMPNQGPNMATFKELALQQFAKGGHTVTTSHWLVTNSRSKCVILSQAPLNIQSTTMTLKLAVSPLGCPNFDLIEKHRSIALDKWMSAIESVSCTCCMGQCTWIVVEGKQNRQFAFEHGHPLKQKQESACIGVHQYARGALQSLKCTSCAKVHSNCSDASNSLRSPN